MTTSTATPLRGAGSSPEAPTDEEIVGYVRSPSDLLRLLVFVSASIVLLGLTRWAEDALIGIETDLIALFSFLSPTVERFLEGSAHVAVVTIAIAVYLPAFVTKRYRLLGYVLIGNLVTAGLVNGAIWWLDRAGLREVTNEVAERAGVTGGLVTPQALAQVVCAFIILAPFVSSRWRRAGAVIVTVLSLLRLLVTAHLPAELFLSLGLGATAGCVVLLAFGRPDQRPTLGAVRESLRSCGLPLVHLERASVDARGSTPYFVTLDDGAHVFAKALSPQERSADLLFRLYRSLRLKNIGDERPFSTLRRSVEHEAMVSLHARGVGLRTPRMRAIAAVGDDSMLLAFDRIEGAPLDRVPAEQVTDELLQGLWRQVELLHQHRIAHRDLRRANVLVDPDGAAWIIDFGFSEVAASDRLLAADVAQLIAALAVAVDPERVVAVAVDELGATAVAAALPLMQPNAFSGATQAALKAHKGLLAQLRGLMQEACQIDEVELAPLARIGRKQLFMFATLALATYFLIPQLTDVSAIIDQVRDASWGWFPVILAVSTFTYVGAAFSLQGCVPQRPPFGPAFIAQVGSSFASKLAPAGLGGMALNTRFLQKAGTDPAVAVTGVGLNTIGGLGVHAVLLGVFVVWAGRSLLDSIRLPDPKIFLYGVAVVAVLAVIALAFGSVRAQLRDRLLPILRRSFDGVASTVRRPTKVALLLGGSLLVTMSYIGALYFSIQAFGGGMGFAQVGAIYLVGSAVASAAPTPGGLGAVEAALIAGLVAGGLDNDVAVPSVFMFRLATFWMPVLPGWVAFTYLQRAEYI